MKLGYYLRGLGTGIVVTALIMGMTAGSPRPLTDAEIKAAAEKLGMVEIDAIRLSDLQGAPDNKEPAEDGTAEPGGGEEGREGSGDTESEAGESEPGSGEADRNESGSAGSESGTSEPNGEADRNESGSVESEGNTSDPDGEASRNGSGSAESGSGAAEPGSNTSDPDGEADRNGNGAAESEAGESEPGSNTSEPGSVEASRNESGASEPDGEADSEEHVTVTVRSGAGSLEICNRLKEAGLIEDARAFDQYLIDQGYSKRISVGTYSIPVGADWEKIAKIITKSR
ncbi:MAG: hypothetical protein NC541_09640 [bacterium]|nr:hypothetical protein [bacterium]